MTVGQALVALSGFNYDAELVTRSDNGTDSLFPVNEIGPTANGDVVID